MALTEAAAVALPVAVVAEDGGLGGAEDSGRRVGTRVAEARARVLGEKRVGGVDLAVAGEAELGGVGAAVE